MKKIYEIYEKIAKFDKDILRIPLFNMLNLT